MAVPIKPLPPEIQSTINAEVFRDEILPLYSADLSELFAVHERLRDSLYEAYYAPLFKKENQ